MLVGDTGLVVQALVDQPVVTADDPLVARLGQFDANETHDLDNSQRRRSTHGCHQRW